MLWAVTEGCHPSATSEKRNRASAVKLKVSFIYQFLIKNKKKQKKTSETGHVHSRSSQQVAAEAHWDGFCFLVNSTASQERRILEALVYDQTPTPLQSNRRYLQWKAADTPFVSPGRLRILKKKNSLIKSQLIHSSHLIKITHFVPSIFAKAQV